MGIRPGARTQPRGAQSLALSSARTRIQASRAHGHVDQPPRATRSPDGTSSGEGYRYDSRGRSSEDLESRMVRPPEVRTGSLAVVRGRQMVARRPTSRRGVDARMRMTVHGRMSRARRDRTQSPPGLPKREGNPEHLPLDVCATRKWNRFQRRGRVRNPRCTVGPTRRALPAADRRARGGYDDGEHRRSGWRLGNWRTRADRVAPASREIERRRPPSPAALTRLN